MKKITLKQIVENADGRKLSGLKPIEIIIAMRVIAAEIRRGK